MFLRNPERSEGTLPIALIARDRKTTIVSRESTQEEREFVVHATRTILVCGAQFQRLDHHFYGEVNLI
jgi:hypothetical protein